MQVTLLNLFDFFTVSVSSFRFKFCNFNHFTTHWILKFIFLSRENVSNFLIHAVIKPETQKPKLLFFNFCLDVYVGIENNSINFFSENRSLTKNKILLRSMSIWLQPDGLPASTYPWPCDLGNYASREIFLYSQE